MTISIPVIAAIVCTRDRHALLRGCLASLAAQTLAEREREIVIVDTSADPAARQRFIAGGGILPEMRLIAGDGSAQPGGLSRSRNIGLAATRAPLVAFIDDDALAEPDWLAELVAAAAAAPRAAVFGGPVLPVWPHGGERPGWLDPWHEGFLSLVDRGPLARDLAAAEWLAGTNIAFRRVAVEREDGFDEALGRRPGTLLGNEEIALAARLRRAGHAVRYTPTARVRHILHPERLTQAWLRRRIAWQAISDLLLAGTEGEAEPASVAGLWRPIGDFLGRMPPQARNLVGLTRDLDDPALARAQGEAISAVIRLLAGHGGSLERALLLAA
jgi:GT2 family glycosyltransferase